MKMFKLFTFTPPRINAGVFYLYPKNGICTKKVQKQGQKLDYIKTLILPLKQIDNIKTNTLNDKEETKRGINNRAKRSVRRHKYKYIYIGLRIKNSHQKDKNKARAKTD